MGIRYRRSERKAEYLVEGPRRQAPNKTPLIVGTLNSFGCEHDIGVISEGESLCEKCPREVVDVEVDDPFSGRNKETLSHRSAVVRFRQLYEVKVLGCLHRSADMVCRAICRPVLDNENRNVGAGHSRHFFE